MQSHFSRQPLGFVRWSPILFRLQVHTNVYHFQSAAHHHLSVKGYHLLNLSNCIIPLSGLRKLINQCKINHLL